MGAYSWSRDKAGKGHTHVAGPVVLPPPQPAAKHSGPPAKRARVWKREDATAAGPSSSAGGTAQQEGGPAAEGAALSPRQQPAGEQPAHPSGGVAQQEAQVQQQPAGAAGKLGGAGPTGMHAAARGGPHQPEPGSSRAGQAAGATAASATAARPSSHPATLQSEAEALRQQILAKQAQLAQAAAASRAAEAAERNRQKQERRQRLEAGFAKVFAQAKEAAAGDIAAGKAPVSFADQVEVARVLGAKSDYDVLKLQPGVDAAAVRRRYREMAVALHPDKCRAAQAPEAFQRVVRAYQGLLAFTR